MIAARAVKKSRGMTVVAVIVCLIIITMVSGAALKISLARRNLVRSQERRLQAEWLAESGAERAKAKLARDHAYTGETWALSARDLGQGEHASAPAKSGDSIAVVARVTITAKQLPGAKTLRHVHIQADYPLDEAGRSRQTKEITIDLDSSPSGAPQ
jgi:type II secretory pathway pseudopilin PulG